MKNELPIMKFRALSAKEYVEELIKSNILLNIEEEEQS